MKKRRKRRRKKYEIKIYSGSIPNSPPVRFCLCLFDSRLDIMLISLVDISS